jgi:hypothetical protein
MYVTKNINGIGSILDDNVLTSLVQIAKAYAMTKCPQVVANGGISDEAIKSAIAQAVLSGKPLNADTANSVVDSLCGTNQDGGNVVEKKTLTTTESNPNIKWWILGGVAAILVGYMAFKK